ncbi:MAG: TonB-dependent receptor [Chitinophagaceae bacterium]|nr:TonB-dependent receptor [Rubrivivax sp.]
MLVMTGLAAEQALAQTAPAQRVEITGSSIRRTDAETASPVQVITKQEIDQSGKSTVAEYLQSLTADGQGSVPFTYGRGFSGATASGISLRGLGANATLVLINGRRVTTAVLADDFQRSFVDLNQIPLEAVERVEVLKDGASSTYGSDAVAGVVNIILKKSFTGTVAKFTYGIAEEGDGKEPRAAITHGFGDLARDGYNVLLNVEYGKRDAIYYRDRAGRGPVGVSAVGQAPWNFNPNVGTNNIARSGGNGWLTTPSAGVFNATQPSIIGNVRNPAAGATNWYSRSDPSGVGFQRTYPGAATFCNANVNLPQNNPLRACINDQRLALNQIQPEHETGNFYGRLTLQINNDLEGFAEVGYYRTESRVDGLPINPAAAYNTITGAVSRATTSIGAGHPDNPYNAAARISYSPMFDTGITGTDSEADTARATAGIKGIVAGWDFDTALSWSKAKQTDTATRVMNWRVADALLNPTAANVAAARSFSPAYAALPAGTLWRIGENAGLNSQALYNALLSDKEREGDSQTYAFDVKVSREFGQLAGGAMGVAFGFESRKEETKLGLYDGLGDFIGLALTSYEGDRTINAAYAEVLLPVLKQLEISGALRVDHYSDAGTSTNPKLGVKWKPLDSFALRGTVSRGFRAPSFPEVSPKVVATFGGTVVDDLARCRAGVPDATCRSLSPTFAATGNPDLEPEKSTSTTLGLVWDLTPTTSLTADLWQIKRKGLPVTGDGQQALDAGQVLRDPTSAVTPTDPGPIVNVFVGYENSDESETRGLDIELKHRMNLGGGLGRLTGTFNWSHLFRQRVIAADGTVRDYAGTHGNCDITNCIGSPKDKVSFATTWDLDQFRVGANVNYRGTMSNKFEKADTSCAQTRADGSDFPDGCKVKSFTTLDLSGAWKFGKNSEIFGSIANVTDRKPPPDFETYGAIGYNPLDYSGAIGRFFRIGAKYQF